MTQAAIQATYSDLKFIRSRKAAQIVLEIPMEAAAAFVEMFGTPNPASETWVALARMEPAKPKATVAAIADGTKPRRKFHELAPSAQAAMRCNEPAFWTFLSERLALAVTNADHAARVVRDLCAVPSRSNLDTDQRAKSAWININAEFDVWMRCAA